MHALRARYVVPSAVTNGRIAFREGNFAIYHLPFTIPAGLRVKPNGCAIGW